MPYILIFLGVFVIPPAIGASDVLALWFCAIVALWAIFGTRRE